MSINITSKFDFKATQTRDSIIKSNKKVSSATFKDTLKKSVCTKAHHDANKKTKEHVNENQSTSSSNNNNADIHKLNKGKPSVIQRDKKKLKDAENKAGDNTPVVSNSINEVNTVSQNQNISSIILSHKMIPKEHENRQSGVNISTIPSNSTQQILGEDNHNTESSIFQKNATRTSAISFEKIEQTITNNSTLGKVEVNKTEEFSISSPVMASTNTVNTTSQQGIWSQVSINPSSPVLEQAKTLLKPMRDHIKFQLDHNIKAATVQLDPPQMGRVDLNIRLDGDRLYVQMHAVNNQIRDALQSGLDRLRNDLNANYQGDIHFELTSDNGSHQSNNKQNQYVSNRNNITLNRSDINKLESSNDNISSNLTRFGQINYFA